MGRLPAQPAVNKAHFMKWTANLPFNWFDIFVLLMLVIGLTRGRKNGMSQETLPFFKWIALLLICSISYEPFGLVIANALKTGKLFGYLMAYCIVAGCVAFLFFFFSRRVAEKMKGTDKFGKAEFYFAMPAGMVRFGCITLALLALLNARQYSADEIKRMQEYQDENYGSNFFPTLASIQDSVFRDSLLGSQVKQHLDFLLIKPTPAAQPWGSWAIKRKEFTW